MKKEEIKAVNENGEEIVVTSPKVEREVKELEQSKVKQVKSILVQGNGFNVYARNEKDAKSAKQAFLMVHELPASVDTLELETRKIYEAICKLGYTFEFKREGSLHVILLKYDNKLVRTLTGNTKKDIANSLKSLAFIPLHSNPIVDAMPDDVQKKYQALGLLGYTYEFGKEGNKKVLTVTGNGKSLVIKAVTYKELSDTLFEQLYSSNPETGFKPVDELYNTFKTDWIEYSVKNNKAAGKRLRDAINAFKKVVTPFKKAAMFDYVKDVFDKLIDLTVKVRTKPKEEAIVEPVVETKVKAKTTKPKTK